MVKIYKRARIYILSPANLATGGPEALHQLGYNISKYIDIYENILDIGYTENEFRMRNNSKIRKLFAEMISIICLSKKKIHLWL